MRKSIKLLQKVLNPKVDLFLLYSETLGIIFNDITKYRINYSEINNSIENLQKDLHILSEFMLVGRFKKNSKKEVKLPKITKDLNVDLIKFLGIGREHRTEAKFNPLHVIKFYKLLENFTLRREYIDLNLDEYDLGKFESICLNIYHNLPKLLLNIDKIEHKERKIYLSYIFSVISIYRQFKVKTLPDASTIIQEYDGEDLCELFKDIFSDKKMTNFFNNIDLSNLNEKCCLYIYSGNASSPNSGASSTKLLDDVAGVIKDEKLLNSIMLLSRHFKGFKHFSYLLETLMTNVKIDPDFMKRKIHSRLFHFTAPGGKARMIANVDWVTQTALSGVHYMLFALLKRIPSDHTFEHKKGIEYLMNNPNNIGKNYYSIDLSAATDRMPRLIQAKILQNLFYSLGFEGSLIAEHWLTVIDREYSCENSTINNGKPTRYAVGQGMGLFSSWSVMALTHHYIVNEICNIDKTRYSLVGDDLVICGTRDEFEMYLNTMKKIGLNVNIHKTLISENTVNPTIEFARNFVIDGHLIDVIPFGTLFAYNESKISFETFLWSIRNWLNVNLIVDLTQKFGKTLNFRKYIYILYYVYKHKLVNIFEERDLLNDVYLLPEWISSTTFDKVIECTQKEKSVFVYHNKYLDNNFMSTFNSQCTVRNIKELHKNAELAKSIAMLSVIDSDIGYMSDIIHNRLNSANIIIYDIDTKGSPLVSKRERKLLDNIGEYYTQLEDYNK